MTKKAIFGLSLLFSTILNAQPDTAAEPLINTTHGVLLGSTDGDVSSFKGIPYAAPPVGEFCWRPPQPVKAWKGVRDAKKFCADCPQRTFPGPAAKGLFHKAISESGGGRDGVLTGRPMRQENADPLYPVSAETIGTNFARKHKIQGTDATSLAKLRSLSMEEILDGGQESDSSGARIYSGPIRIIVSSSLKYLPNLTPTGYGANPRG